VLLAGGALAGCAGGLGEPRYGVCRQQIEDFVHQRLGHTVTRIEFQSYAERTPPVTLFDTGNALAFVKECDGFHSFEVRGTEDLCEHIPHYGRSSGSYVRYEGAFEGCKRPR
jgi:hypothetical protein